MYSKSKNVWTIVLVILCAVLAIGVIVALLPDTEGGIKDQINGAIDDAVNGGSETKDPADSEQDPSACSHVWVDFEVKKEATCTVAGSKVQICELCEETKNTVIPATGHAYVDLGIVQEATCTTSGVMSQACNNCQSVKNTTIMATGHDYVTVAVKTEATCTTAGVESQLCNNCQDVKDVMIKALGHKYTEWTTGLAATCTSDGYKTRSCSVCNITEKQNLPATGHFYVDYYLSNGDGTHSLVCSACHGAPKSTSTCVKDSSSVPVYCDDTYHEYDCLFCEGTVKVKHSKIPNSDGVQYCPACTHVFE